MGANQSQPGQRPRQNNSNPPPPYFKGVTTTATPKDNGPQKPGPKGLLVKPERLGEQCTADLVAKLESLERAVSELQRAGAPKPFYLQAMLTSTSKTPTAGTQDTIEDQREVIEKEMQSLKEQNRNLEEQKSSLEKEKSHWEKEKAALEEKNMILEVDNKYLEEQRNRLEERLEERMSALQRSDETRRSYLKAITRQSEVIGGQSWKIRELRDDLQTMSNEALKAKVLSGKGNDQAASVTEPCHCTQHPGS